MSAAFRAGLGARWTFLASLLETTDPGNAPYLPTVLTLFPDLTIHAVYNGYWFWGPADQRGTASRLSGDHPPDPDGLGSVQGSDLRKLSAHCVTDQQICFSKRLRK